MPHFAALLLLSALAAPAPRPASPPADANVVEICSVALGTCSSLPAAALDPTLHAALAEGQLAFVDPQSGALVAPTEEQAAELASTIAIAEEQKAATQPVVETMPNGTVRARGDFRVFLRAELKPAPKPAAKSGAQSTAAAELKP